MLKFLCRISSSSTLETLTKKQKDIFNEGIKEFFEYRCEKNWKTVIKETSMYKKPHLVDAVNTREDFTNELFVYPSFFAVGRHDYIIRSPGSNPFYMCSSTISDIRVEEIPDCKQTFINHFLFRQQALHS
jgi:hypothetical protein